MKRENLLEVVFFETGAGAMPVRDFLMSLPREDRKEIGADIYTVQLMFPIPPPLVKKIAPDLWEVRSKTANGIFRVFFTVAGQHMILLHGFVKKSQQTPREHLDTAKDRLAEFRRVA